VVLVQQRALFAEAAVAVNARRIFPGDLAANMADTPAHKLIGMMLQTLQQHPLPPLQ
jgi:hypothetical protein